jgi:hypothetical protein
MASITVRCDPDGEGWICAVTMREAGIDISTHHVRVWASDLKRFAPNASEPEALVKQSFAFLLDRESPQMILRSFDLSVIERYFPEYESDIRRRLNPPPPPRERGRR